MDLNNEKPTPNAPLNKEGLLEHASRWAEYTDFYAVHVAHDDRMLVTEADRYKLDPVADKLWNEVLEGTRMANAARMKLSEHFKAQLNKVRS